ncbi:MAG: branched-chain amino acid ABC transporter permease [Deltaproteobacteria bacterium]|nr:branched-chain amino acid ABC transporter permease [Deltaproteobacteria bacterium]MBW2102592.1 branched-chain amino acid ABC transporter permease [Deltaproteobacteria bacterium]RLB38713.1 MAG: branched-chain amino acid ABC transporter permease [Deltaproteobacteria bacterium]
MDITIIAQALIQGLMLGAIYGLIGLGITMVYAITGLLNFAHGDFMAIAMYLCLALFTHFNMDPYLSSLIAVPALFVLGLLVYHFLFRRVLKAELLMVVQLTLGMVFIIESSLLLTFTADYESVPNILHAVRFSLGPLSVSGSYLATFLVGGGAGAALYWVLQKTDLGRQIRAISQNKDAATLMGINTTRIQMIVFALAIALLGLSGSLTTSILTMEPYMGLELTLFAFIVFVMGGVGNFLGTLVAGYLLGIADAMGSLFIGGHLGAMVPYGLFVLLLLFRPQGILGAK